MREAYTGSQLVGYKMVKEGDVIEVASAASAHFSQGERFIIIKYGRHLNMGFMLKGHFRSLTFYNVSKFYLNPPPDLLMEEML